jgi:hypothetical protein
MAYILSASHSGSTLLAMLLGTQHQACTVGELRAPSMGDTDAYRCSCGQKIKECAFWTEVSERMAKKGIQAFDITDAGTSIFEVQDAYAQRLLSPLFRGPVLETVRDLALGFSPIWQSYLKEVQRRNAAIVEVLSELAGAKVVIDSSKAGLQLKYLLRNPALDIKVIHLVRDGRAVALSLIGHGLKRPTRQETMAATAREWRRSNEAAECLVRRLPSNQWLQIQYEELCRQPAAILRHACNFLGLETGNLNLDFRAHQQHILGNEMRLKTTSEIRLDERWRSELSAEDLSVFEIEAGEMNRKFGYG